MIGGDQIGQVLLEHARGAVHAHAEIAHALLALTLGALKARLAHTLELVYLVAHTLAVLSARLVQTRVELGLAQLASVCRLAHASRRLGVTKQRAVAIATSAFLGQFAIFTYLNENKIKWRGRNISGRVGVESIMRTVEILSALATERVDAVDARAVVLARRVGAVVDLGAGGSVKAGRAATQELVAELDARGVGVELVAAAVETSFVEERVAVGARVEWRALASVRLGRHVHALALLGALVARVLEAFACAQLVLAERAKVRVVAFASVAALHLQLGRLAHAHANASRIRRAFVRLARVHEALASVCLFVCF